MDVCKGACERNRVSTNTRGPVRNDRCGGHSGKGFAKESNLLGGRLVGYGIQGHVVVMNLASDRRWFGTKQEPYFGVWIGDFVFPSQCGCWEGVELVTNQNHIGVGWSCIGKRVGSWCGWGGGRFDNHSIGMFGERCLWWTYDDISKMESVVMGVMVMVWGRSSFR